MIYVLMLCTFMSSSGEVCEDIRRYSTIGDCVAEADRLKPTEEKHKRYICEGRLRGGVRH